MNVSPPAIHLYQIAYSAATLAAVEPGFEVLDNLANPRPDWYEFLPIRAFLRSRVLDDDAFYGFLSPRFGQKTGWCHADMLALLQDAADTVDVALFSAHPNQIAYFLNVFEQGDYFHPGLRAACRDWLAEAGIAAPDDRAVADVRQTVFCNYFVARPAFWRAWLALGDSLQALCEGPPTELQRRLTADTGYRGAAQMKVFVMERLASLLLALQPQWRVRVADPYRHGKWPSEALRADPTSAICSDALKYAHRTQPFPEYLAAFGALRQQVLGGSPA